MKLIPLLKVRNIKEAVAFYTTILDFELKYPTEELNIYCIDLINRDAELTLSEIDGIFGVPVTVVVDDVDNVFARYLGRGLITPKSENSPVHESPVNQTWGTREFYVTDIDGNTLRFTQRSTG